MSFIRFLTILFFYITAIQAKKCFTFAFDDTFRHSKDMINILDEHNYKATVYISAGRLCRHPDYLIWDDVERFYNDGHEIAGHGLAHLKSFQLDYTSLKNQICCNRALLRRFNPTNMAYPHDQWNTTIQTIVQECGYNSARISGANPGEAETIPPANIWTVESYSIRRTDSFEDLKYRIDNALALDSDRWIIFNFHVLCEHSRDRCTGHYKHSITRENYNTLVEYIKTFVDAGTLEVKRAVDVIGLPASPIPRSFDGIDFPYNIDTFTDTTSSASKLNISLIVIVIVSVIFMIWV